MPRGIPVLAWRGPETRIGEGEVAGDPVLRPKAAQFVTGEFLHVDGGAHAGGW